MRKIPEKYENPVDNIIISIAEAVNPIFYKLGFTPNYITTLSLIIGIYSTYLFLQGYRLLAGILFLVAYFLDCADGNFARTYKMSSKYGGYYDVTSDFFKNIFLYFALYKVNPQYFICLIPFIIVLSLLCMVQLRCQDLFYEGKKNKFNICPGNKKNVTKYLKFTRFFGCGTFYLFLFFVIITYPTNT